MMEVQKRQQLAKLENKYIDGKEVSELLND